MQGVKKENYLDGWNKRSQATILNNSQIEYVAKIGVN
jgi:hypothetical protein